MGEKSVFATQAHVFQIDPQTKKRWLPASTSAVRVSFYHDASRKTYRIIAIENSKALVNSTITANMNFTKTSPKFGQWSDHRATTVYGLGFSSERDLNEFVDKFSEAKAAIKRVLEERKQAGKMEEDKEGRRGEEKAASSSSPSSSPDFKTEEGGGGRRGSGEEGRKALKEGLMNGEHSGLSNGTESSGSGSPPSVQESQLDSLKYENSKLKTALASSAQNVKKWESELQTLKANNAKLTTALQESNHHVAEWKDKLQQYKEESEQLKMKVLQMEQERREYGGEGGREEWEAVRKENEELKEVLSAVQLDLEERQKEVKERDTALGEVTTQLEQAREKAAFLEEESASLSARVTEVEDALKMAAVASQRKMGEAREGNARLGEQLQHLVRLHQTLSSLYEV